MTECCINTTIVLCPPFLIESYLTSYKPELHSPSLAKGGKMTLDANWLNNILKTSGGRLTAITIAAALFIGLSKNEMIPGVEPWMIAAGYALGLLCGCLALLAGVSAIQKWIAPYNKARSEKRELRLYIPYMTEHELEIIGYLLARNQKTFTCALDGGYAVTLISRGIVRFQPVPRIPSGGHSRDYSRSSVDGPSGSQRHVSQNP